MDTDLQYYTRMIIEQRSLAMLATSAEQRRAHERRAEAFRLQMQRLSAEAAASAPETRLRPLPLAA